MKNKNTVVVSRGWAKGVSAEDFVRIWQKSASVKDVAERTGMDKYACYYRAIRYRRIGIPLKKFGTGQRRVDVAGLKKIALSCAGADNSGK